MKPAATRLAIALCLLFLAVPRAGAQTFGETEQKILDQFRQAAELNDVREMSKLARKYPSECATIYNELESRMANNDSIEAWDEIKRIARAIDDIDGANVYEIRMKFVMGLSLEQRTQRDEARARYDGLRNALRNAKTNKDRDGVNQAIEQLRELSGEFAVLGDLEHQCYCLSEVAGVLNEREEQLEAVKLWDEVDSILTGAGYRQFKFQGDVQRMRDSLKAQGYDPNAQPGEEAEATRNTGTTWSSDPAGQTYSDPLPLKCVEDEKLPTKFITPSFCSGENTQVWRDFTLVGDNKQVTFAGDFRPLGDTFEVSRQGVKIFMHRQGAAKPEEIKVITKPNLVRVDKEYEDYQGAKQRLEYSWLACTGGTEEARFGLSINSSPQPDQYVIRYHPACYLKGKVLGLDLIVLDDNASGRFGDAYELPDTTSTLEPTFSFCDAMILGKEKVASPYSEFVFVDGAFYRMTLSPTDYTVRTRKLAVDTGTVTLKFQGKVAPACVILEETREFKGAFFAIGAAPVTVPVGLYRVSYGIVRKGKGPTQDYCLILPGKFESFPVKKDEARVVELGEPFALDFQTEQLPGGSVKVIGRSVVVYGKAGELYTHFFDNPIIPEKVAMRVKGGGAAGKARPMARATFEDFRKEGRAIWGPLDLTFEGDPDNAYEVKMDLKSHDLLGGPLTSGWK